MAETINNTASATYTLSGASMPETATSNALPINFDNSQNLTLTKTANPTEFSAGDIISYTVTITNPSGNYYNGIRIIDNLGGGNLAYVLGSASLTTNSQTYPVTPIATNPLTFTLQQLASGATMTLTYRAQVIFNLPSNVGAITNSVQGIGYTSSQSFSAYTSATIEKKTSGDFVVAKSANVSTVVPNQLFNYFVTLTNGNDVLANVSTITDLLPANFTLTRVALQIGTGSPVVLSPSQYTLSGDNLLTVPAGAGPEITVPANGSTLLTITGYLS